MEVTSEELLARLDDETLTIVDVRTADEFAGRTAAPCDPRRGHIPGSRNIDVSELMGMTPDQVRARVGLPAGSEIVCYCHSGGRSAIACSLLRAAGYAARNYEGSWHEWSHADSLPIEP